MTLSIDHFTPLSRAVASIDRDAYAVRFAIYDREHKELLRRLATAEEPCSDADVAREEQAFREAIRRIEFGDEHIRSTPVPQVEPAEAAPEPRREPPWLEVRPAEVRPPDVHLPEGGSFAERETFDPPSLPGIDPSEPGIDPSEPGIAEEPLAPLADLRLSEPRSVARRVGERLALAALALALAGGWVWWGEVAQEAANSTALRGAVEPAESTAPAQPAAPDNTTEAKVQQPAWLSPEIMYAPPNLPPSPPPPGPALASVPRPDVPLPVPRPER
jgi:hypothetical protein